jgi:hypothetical protein
LICKSFGWITSWGSTVAGAQHGGRVWWPSIPLHVVVYKSLT